MILVCGEGLIDFLPTRSEAGHACYRPMVGGSPLNVAVGLGRLGVATGFAGGISTDFFGDMLAGALTGAGVDLTASARLDRPSTLAFASLDAIEPRYAFYDAAAADRHFVPAALPAAATVLHTGSLALVREPSAAGVEAVIRAARADGRLVSLDPNIRPDHIPDAAAHRARLARCFAIADLVKLSLADLAWIAPGQTAETFAAALLHQGVGLVVVTRGGEGASAFRDADRFDRPTRKVRVVDTVGAGDAFMAGLLAGLAEAGCLSPGALRGAGEAAIGHALALALLAGAHVCARPGADPPWRRELDIQAPRRDEGARARDCT